MAVRASRVTTTRDNETKREQPLTAGPPVARARKAHTTLGRVFLVHGTPIGKERLRRLSAVGRIRDGELRLVRVRTELCVKRTSNHRDELLCFGLVLH